MRFSVAAIETVAASALRRAALTGEEVPVARVCDLPCTVELESGAFVWCTVAHPGEEPSPLSGRITTLLQVLR